MAKARPSALIGGIAGSLNATTFRNTRSGLVVAARGFTCRRQSTGQLSVQRTIQQLHDIWVALTPSQRQGWSTAAKTVSWPDRLAIGKHPTAYNLFISCNLTFWGGPVPDGFGAITDPPAGQTPPPLSWSVSLSPTTGVQVTADSPLLPDASLYEILHFSLALRPTQDYAPRLWTRGGRMQVDSTELDWSDTLAPFGIVIEPGQQVAVKIVWMRFDGIPSAPVWQKVQVSA